MDSLDEKPLDLRSLLRVLTRFWWLPIVLVASFAAVAAWWSARQPEVFEARSSVLIRTALNRQLFPPVGQSAFLFERQPTSELEYVNSDAFRAAVDPSQATVTAVVPDASNLLVFIASGPDVETVVAAANHWAESYIALRHEREVTDNEVALGEAEITRDDLETEKDRILSPLSALDDAIANAQLDDETTSEQISLLTTQRVALQQSLSDDLQPVENDLRTLNAEIAVLESKARFLERPDISAIISRSATSARQTAPQPVRDISAAAALGLFTALAGAFLLDTARDRITDLDGLGELVHPVPVIGSIPRSDPDLQSTSLLSRSVIESLEQLLTIIGLTVRSRQVRAIVVTSPNESEGKSSTAHWLAERAARQGVHTLLIDADLRRPRLHTALRIPQSPGLNELAVELRAGTTARVDIRDYISRVVGDGWTLDVIPAGMPTGPDPATLLRDRGLTDVFEQLRDHYELVLIDSPPLLPVTDAVVLAELAADGVLLTCRAGKSRRSHVRQALRALEPVNSHVVGVVMVGARRDRKSSYYQ